MRVHPSLALAVATTLVACGGNSTDATPAARGFQVVTPDVTLAPGQEIHLVLLLPHAQQRAHGDQEVVVVDDRRSARPGPVHHRQRRHAAGHRLGRRLRRLCQRQPPELDLRRQFAGRGAGAAGRRWKREAARPGGRGCHAGLRPGPLCSTRPPAHSPRTPPSPPTRSAPAWRAPGPRPTWPPPPPSPSRRARPTTSRAGPAGSPRGPESRSLSTRAHKHAVQTLVEDGHCGGTVLLTSTDPGAPRGEDLGRAVPHGSPLRSHLPVHLRQSGQQHHHLGRERRDRRGLHGDRVFFPATRSLLCVDNTGPL